MQIFLLILFGFVSGILGGMGMGGGTLLVPLLSFLNIEQKTVQAINLVSFLPMCIVALGLHLKNKLVKKQKIGWLIVPAVLSAVGGAFLTKYAGSKILKICFGVFLLGIGVWQLVVAIRFVARRKKRLVVVFSQTPCLNARRSSDLKR